MDSDSTKDQSASEAAVWTKEHFACYLAERGGHSYEDALKAVERAVANGIIPALRPTMDPVN